jgi:hypothetical protein
MTPAEYHAKPAIEHLRLMVRNFDGCRESFNQRFTAEQLLKLHKAWMLSEWDISPDRWADWQVGNALSGLVPEWDSDGNPVVP